MKSKRTLLISLFVIASSLLAACGGAARPASQPVKVSVDGNAAQVEFTGNLDAINGNQWTVGGQTVEVDQQTALGRDFRVGDQVQVHATVHADGSVKADTLTAPGQVLAQNSGLQASSNTGGGSSATPQPEATATPAAAGQNAREFVGAVEAINGNQWTIGGQVFTITNATELKDALAVGDLAKVQVIVNPDGSLTVVEIGAAPAGAAQGWDDNGQDPSVHEAGDDHGAEPTDSNDDHGQDSSNNGGNSGGDNGGHGGGDGGHGGSGH